MKQASGIARTLYRYSIRVMATTALAAFACGVHAQTTLVVATYGGTLGASLKEVFEPFEKQHNVTIRWVPGGSSAENVARVVATKEKPEFDVVFGDNMTHYTGSAQGLWATIDESIVTRYKDQSPKAKVPSKDVISFGFYLTGLFYQDKEFEKRGWKPPTRWADLFRPEFCGRVGILHPNVSYGLNAVIMLAGGDPAKVSDGIAKIAANKNCISVLEPTVSKLDEKVQLGDYLIGANGNIRIIPLMQKGAQVKFRIPDEGTLIVATSVSVVKNSAHQRLGQEFCNWILGPDVQFKLMEKTALAPTNMTVTVPREMAELGVPNADMLKRAIYIPEKIIYENRRAWIRAVERAMEK